MLACSMKPEPGSTEPGRAAGKLACSTELEPGSTEPGTEPGRRACSTEPELGSTEPGMEPGKRACSTEPELGSTEPGKPGRSFRRSSRLLCGGERASERKDLRGAFRRRRSKKIRSSSSRKRRSRRNTSQRKRRLGPPGQPERRGPDQRPPSKLSLAKETQHSQSNLHMGIVSARVHG